MCIFYGMLNAAGINSGIILSSVNPHDNSAPKYTRFCFLKNLALQLVTEHLKNRLQTKNLPPFIRSSITNILKIEVPVLVQHDEGNKSQGRCCLCSRNKDRKSKTRCATCNKFVCDEHKVVICSSCYNEVGGNDNE